MTAALAKWGDLLEPGEAQEPILSAPLRGALMDWLREVWAQDDLEAVGLRARRRAIFGGPPGVGKTTLAHHLAARLGLRMLIVDSERLISKYLGDTARNIAALFAEVKRGREPLVLFFDEFDGLAVDRSKLDQSRADQERAAFVNTLLQQVERADCFIIAATNFSDRIDPAIWRRFQMHVTLELPGQPEREMIVARYLAPFGLPSRPLAAIAEALEGAAPSLIRDFCEGLKRALVLGERLGWDMRREALLDRVIASASPHPSLGKPRLWSHGSADAAVRLLPWPLPRAADLPKEEDPPAQAEPSTGNVVEMKRPG